MSIEIEDEAVLESVYQTILIEAEGTKTDRGSAEIIKIDNSLIVKISATDFVALRALTNSMMRLLKTSLEIAESI